MWKFLDVVIKFPHMSKERYRLDAKGNGKINVVEEDPNGAERILAVFNVEVGTQPLQLLILVRLELSRYELDLDACDLSVEAASQAIAQATKPEETLH